jgi:3-hydroxyisobutyrate dehydrogenase-like beta-hydroxyacid dehydrogenase
MTKERAGIIHPGNMGASVAAAVKGSGHEVLWASEGRSPQTHERASSIGLFDAGTLAELCRRCSVLLSVCPPHAAEHVAEQVLSHSFSGLYLDANAISPQRAERISRRMLQAGVTFIDGGIIGDPAWSPGRTWLYLSGPEAEAIASLFSEGPLEVEVIGQDVGKASALKMCYAANTKGTTALLCAVLAAAERLGVREELQQQWTRGEAGYAERTTQRIRNVTEKAWRFAGEMEEIASTFRGAGLPGEFHDGASVLYRRLAGFKDAPSSPPLEEVLAALARPEDPP